MRKWRMIPLVSYTNWSSVPGMRKRWPCVKRYWSGRLVYLRWLDHQITLDFRQDVLEDLREISG
jgi:hypothetical protein